MGTKVRRGFVVTKFRQKIEAAYRRRHRQWVMEAMPDMPDAEWKAYTAWVAAFGLGQKSRRLQRRLTAIKEGRVTSAGNRIHMRTARGAQRWAFPMARR